MHLPVGSFPTSLSHTSVNRADLEMSASRSSSNDTSTDHDADEGLITAACPPTTPVKLFDHQPQLVRRQPQERHAEIIPHQYDQEPYGQ